MPWRRWAGLLLGVVLAGAAAGQSTRGPTIEEAHRLRQAGEFDRAVNLYESIVRSDPQNADAWFFLGYTLHEQGELDRAIYVHRKAAQFPRYRGVALYNIGCAYALAGDTDRAFEALREALNAGFTGRRQFENDDDLRTLRGDPRWEQLFGVDDEGRNHQLDFWLGEWEVFSQFGRRLGAASVFRRGAGFAIHEVTQGPFQQSAEGLLYFDPERKVWRYTRVDERGGVMRLEGQYEEGGARFNGSRIMADGSRVAARARLIPADNGNVQLAVDQSYDNGATWEPVSDLRFVQQVPTSAPASAPASFPAALQRPRLGVPATAPERR